ncbi:MAG: trypsin-like serine peptidase [Bacteriovoracaceae bacterium]
MKKFLLPLALLSSIQVQAATESIFLNSLNIRAIHDEEVLREVKGEAPRFAVAHVVSASPSFNENWQKSGENVVWSYQVKAPNAVSLNFGFTHFELPVGASVSVYSTDRSQFMRPFTSLDNNEFNQLWTPVIMSDDVIVELSVPANKVSELKFEVGHIGQGFRTFSDRTERSGDCNVDVACSDSQGWEKEVNAVAVISTGGSKFCTGFMVNNAEHDKTPFFMTANHCQITASTAPSLVAYWNYQTSSCQGPRDGKLTDFQTGSKFLAANAKTDFTLVKLLKAPNAAWNVSYAGWSNIKENAKSTTVIHHPNTDEKSISFSSLPTTFNGYGIDTTTSDTTHVRVADYDTGTTEPGSSGSPLFDQNHRVIGQLHGGGAACGNDDPDWYGSFAVSWASGSTPATRLKDHLDPKNKGVKFVNTLE